MYIVLLNFKCVSLQGPANNLRYFSWPVATDTGWSTSVTVLYMFGELQHSYSSFKMMPTEEFCRAVSTIRDIERLDNDDPDVLGDDSYDYLQTLLWAASTIVTICENQTNETEKKAFTYTDKLTKQIESQSKEISKLTFNLAAGQATIKRYSETIERKEEGILSSNNLKMLLLTTF